MNATQPENAVATQGASRALTVKEETVDRILGRVQAFQKRGELDLPAVYSAGNALKSAWLMLQDIKDKNDKPALQVCTRESIANALLDMVVQGLNPVKKQGHFIVYGTRLSFMRSYFGAMHVAKQVSKKPIDDIVAQVVYDGDVFEYAIHRGKKYVTKHTQKLGNVDGKKIVAAYCQVFYEDGQEATDIMTIDQIKRSWAKSKMNPNGENSTHTQFTEEMAKRTVINRTCKPIINDSTDEHLFRESFLRADEIRDEAEAEEEIAANANQEVIDIDRPAIEHQERNSVEIPEAEVVDVPVQNMAGNSGRQAAAEAGPSF